MAMECSMCPVREACMGVKRDLVQAMRKVYAEGFMREVEGNINAYCPLEELARRLIREYADRVSESYVELVKDFAQRVTSESVGANTSP